MGIKCGIVGLPNVGKSTLFNALTKAAIPAENYPFCTIDPNVGVVGVPDARMNGQVTFGMNAVIEDGFERSLRVGMQGRATIRFE